MIMTIPVEASIFADVPVNTIPKVGVAIQGAPILAASFLTDDGITLKYKGSPVGGGSVPGGADTQLQYNNAGAFSGTPGGFTNGHHFAFGTGAAIDDVAPSVLVLEETQTGDDATCLLSYLKYSPNVPSVGAQAIYGQLDVNLDAGGETGNTSALDCEIYNVGTTVRADGVAAASFYGDNPGGGPISFMAAVNAGCDNSGTGQVDSLSQININPCSNSGVVTEMIGLRIQAMQGGVATYQIKSEGVALSDFAGPLSAPTYRSRTIFKASGPALPSAATEGKGAHAMVSDATAATFNTAYTGNGTNNVPVFSDGSVWRIG